MKQRVRLEIAPSAEADIEEILGFSIAEFGKPVGLAYVSGLRESFSRLLENPHIAPEVPDDRKGRRMLKHRGHFIYFRIDSHNIRILRILQKARDAKRLLN